MTKQQPITVEVRELRRSTIHIHKQGTIKIECDKLHVSTLRRRQIGTHKNTILNCLSIRSECLYCKIHKELQNNITIKGHPWY